MNFDTLGYVAFLLASVFGVHLVRRTAAREWMLLLGSWFFYSVWDPRFIVLLLAVTVISFAGGLILARAPDDRKATVRLVAVGTLLLPLVFFKYAVFLAGTVLDLLALADLRPGWGLPDILLPVGISFFTFQAIGYVLDVGRGHLCAEPSFRRYALYLAFFPQLVAGPIVRAADFLPQLNRPWRAPSSQVVALSVARFLWGMAKKVLIADHLGSSVVNPVFANLGQASGGAIVLATLAFGFQIYADFSAYSDMAISSSRLLGFRLLENFRAPYTATSLRDFWRRWHVSLSTLIRDYVYIPLGGSRGVSRRRTAVNAFASMVLCGLWHGAAWSFVAWGGLHGGAMVAERQLARFAHGGRAVRVVLGWLATQSVVFSLWFLFRIEGGGAGIMTAVGRLGATGLVPYDMSPQTIAALAAEALLLFAEQLVIRAWSEGLVAAAVKRRIGMAQGAWVATAAGIGVVFVLGFDVDATSNVFIYFRF